MRKFCLFFENANHDQPQMLLLVELEHSFTYLATCLSSSGNAKRNKRINIQADNCAVTLIFKRCFLIYFLFKLEGSTFQAFR